MLERRPDVKHALYGGIITGATVGLPVLDILNCFCCAGVILGGFLAVFFHTRDLQGQWITQADAIQLGVLSGLFGAVIGTVLHAFVLFTAGDAVLEMISSILEQGVIQESLPPGLEDALSELIFSGEGFTAIDIVAHLVIWIFVGPLFGLLGGLLGFSILRPKAPPPFMNPDGSSSRMGEV